MKKQLVERNDKVSKSDIEKLEILQKANEKRGKQLSINLETGALEEFDEIKKLTGKEFDDPKEKYRLYYNGIRRLLMNYLPKGKENKQIRQIIYDEKNIFLNLGKKKSDNNGIRKSDGRMTYQPVMGEILDIIIKWIETSQNPFDLYRNFYKLNDKYGYGHEKYDESTSNFAEAMKSLQTTTMKIRINHNIEKELFKTKKHEEELKIKKTEKKENKSFLIRKVGSTFQNS